MLRVKALLDGFLIVLGASTVLLLTLVLLLSARLRAGEMRTLRRIGAPARVSLWLHALETGLVLAAASVVALGAVLLALFLVPDPSRFFA